MDKQIVNEITLPFDRVQIMLNEVNDIKELNNGQLNCLTRDIRRVRVWADEIYMQCSYEVIERAKRGEQPNG